MTSRFPTSSEILSWPEPNFVDPETKQPLAMGINVVMSFVIVSFICCRFYSRTRLVKALWWDDWIMLLAALCQIGNNVMIIISMDKKYKMGYHMWDIELKMLMGVMKSAQMGMASQLMINVVAALTKVSILFTYLRLFPTKLSKWFCWFMLAYTITLSFACFWLVLFQCSPAATYWQIFKYYKTAKCLNVKAIYYFYTGQNTLSDFLIFLWPAKELSNVKISFRQRFTLITMFSFGVIICIVGLARVYYTHLYLTDFDTFWNGALLLIICALESSLGIACGCLPSCKPLLSFLLPNIFGPISSQNRNGDSDASGSRGESIRLSRGVGSRKYSHKHGFSRSGSILSGSSFTVRGKERESAGSVGLREIEEGKGYPVGDMNGILKTKGFEVRSWRESGGGAGADAGGAGTGDPRATVHDNLEAPPRILEVGVMN